MSDPEYSLGVEELRRNLARYLQKAAAGETITVYRYSKEIAVIMPPSVDLEELSSFIKRYDLDFFLHVNVAGEFVVQINDGDAVKTIVRPTLDEAIEDGMKAALAHAATKEACR